MATTTLNTGATLPLVGLGCWMGFSSNGSIRNDETFDMVTKALEIGYRHFDTAAGYGNEEAVGEAIKASSVPRKDVFVTTKLTREDHGRVAEAFDKSLSNLGLEYIDLYLMHWPQAHTPDGTMLKPEQSPTIHETWRDMEALLETGKVKAIGVSNYSIKTLTQLLETAKVPPAVNQVECHPFYPNHDLTAFCKEKNIHLTAYCPLGQYNSPILTDPLIMELAKKYGKSTGQVLLSWAVQRGGWSVVPKSSNPGRLAQNLDTFTLDRSDHEAISSLHSQPGKYRSLCEYASATGLGTPGMVYGWTMEELGWDGKLWSHVWDV